MGETWIELQAFRINTYVGECLRTRVNQTQQKYYEGSQKWNSQMLKMINLKLIEHHQETCHFGVSTHARSFIEETHRIELSISQQNRFLPARSISGRLMQCPGQQHWQTKAWNLGPNLEWVVWNLTKFIISKTQIWDNLTNPFVTLCHGRCHDGDCADKAQLPWGALC